MTIEEEFNEDVKLMLQELKREELANANSEYKIRFILLPKSNNRPDEQSQNRILEMLSNRKAIELKPFYHTNMTVLDEMLKLRGVFPVGYWIKIIQPNFNEVYDEYITLSEEDKKKIKAKAGEKENKIRVDDKNIGHIILDDGGELEVGPANNVPFKMIQVFCPFGKSVSVDSAYGKTSPRNSKNRRANLSLVEKEKTLKARIKELQDVLPKKRIKVRMKFNKSDGTVFIEKCI